jgi:hypothetical protein
MRHMKNRVVLIGALLASTGLIAMGAGIDGKWTVTTQGRGGDVMQTLTLTSSGMNLTGKFDNGNGMPVDITEGMIHDSDVTFKVTTTGRGGNPQVTTYKGTLSGDDLKLTGTREAAAGGGAPGGGGGGGGKGGGGGGGRGPQELTFKRAK